MSGRARARRGSCLSARLLLISLLCGLTTLTAAAQVGGVPALRSGAEVPAVLRSRSVGSAIALEGVVDPEEYLVGPGDVFAFSIGGRIPIADRSTVTADGMLIVPEVGSFRVAGRSLGSVRAELRAAMRRRYTNVETDAALAEPRRFIVHVSGNVMTPGRHEVVPVARLEDALAEAMGESPRTALRRMHLEEVAVLPALRNVQVTHTDGSNEVVDLLHYYATGDTRSNPHLREGDVVHVPSFTRRGRAVFVEDRFGDPVPYDYRDGDTAADVLTVARGRRAELSVDAIRVMRVGAGGAVTAIDLGRGALARGEAASLRLEPLDRVRLVEPHAEIARVEAVGAVRFPGNYSVEADRTTLRQLVELAGGLDGDALLRAAYLERRGSNWPNPEFETNYRPTLADIEPENRAQFVELQAYEATRLSGLPFESMQYLSRELMTFQRLSLDLSAVLSGAVPDVTLRDGDRLVVPQDPGGVMVVGHVERPGLVPFRAGADAEEYVAMAGGRGPAATETYLREAAGGAVRPAGGADIRSGDVLFVDREPAAFTDSQQGILMQRLAFESQERRDRADARYRVVSTVLQVVATAVSTVALYVTLGR